MIPKILVEIDENFLHIPARAFDSVDADPPISETLNSATFILCQFFILRLGA